MRNRMYEEIRNVLREHGFDYMVYGEKLFGPVRHLMECSSVYAVLRDNREIDFETERLADVFESLQKKEIYPAIFPEVKIIHKEWEYERQARSLETNELMVCFIRNEVFQTGEEVGALILASLKTNFLYLQEEEEVLELERSLQVMVKAFTRFRQNAFDIQKVERCSAQLRAYYKNEGHATLCSKNYGRYMEDYVRMGHAEKMDSVAFCLDVVGNGKA